MRVADCAEVLFYMMVDMLGLLTWRGLADHRVNTLESWGHPDCNGVDLTSVVAPQNRSRDLDMTEMAT